MATSAYSAPEMKRDRELNGAEPWRDVFYLNVFMDVALTQRQIERHERVWIHRFLANRGAPELYRQMEETIAVGHVDQAALETGFAHAAHELSPGEKRRFVYNLAQLLESKGKLTDSEYARVLDIADKLGIADTEADSMLHSVFSLNDTLLAVIGVLAGGAILYFARTVVVPLIIAILLTMIIGKVESFMRRKLAIRRFRWLTKLSATLLILSVFACLVLAAIASGTDIADRFGFYQEKLTAVVQNAQQVQTALAWLRGHGVVNPAAQLPIASLLTDLAQLLAGMLGNFVLIAIFTGFMVSSDSKFTGILQEINEKIGGYIFMKTVMSLLTGVLVTVECWIFGIDFAIFWGLLAFLLNYIPTVGSIVATVPLVLLAVVQIDSWGVIVFFALNLIVLLQLIGQVLEPKLMGSRLGLKPIAILLGLVFWGLLWGIPGMFLATPLMVVLRMLAAHFNVSRGFERLLATETT